MTDIPQINRHSRRMRWYLRVPLKWMLFAIVVFFVLFPDPVQFRRHLKHIANYNAMIDPGAPQFAAWESEIRERLNQSADVQRRKHRKQQQPTAPVSESTPSATTGWNDALSPAAVQQAVERLVYDKVKYDWDWNVWGSADYMPTVAEMFAQTQSNPDGVLREDCDGRAVMAASLMRRLGYQSSIVTDLRHVWVATPQGEWMGPGRGKTMKSTKKGNQVDLLATISNVPVSLSYGVAVFPFWREAIITLAAWLLLSRRGMGEAWFFIGGILLFQGLLFMRTGILAPKSLSGAMQSWPAWVGILHLAVGIFALMRASLRAGRARIEA